MSFEFRLELWENNAKKEELITCGTLDTLKEIFEVKSSSNPSWANDPNLYLKLFINKRFHIPEIICNYNHDKRKGMEEILQLV